MSYPRTPTTTTSAATTTPNVTPNEPYAASPATPTGSATPSASPPSKPPRITHRCFSHRYFRRSPYERSYRELAAQLADIGFIASGSLALRHNRCGTKTCRCHADPPQLHGPYWQWTAK